MYLLNRQRQEPKDVGLLQRKEFMEDLGLSTQDKIRSRLHKIANEQDNNARDARTMNRIKDELNYGTNQFNIYQKVDDAKFDDQYRKTIEQFVPFNNNYTFRRGNGYDRNADMMIETPNIKELVEEEIKKEESPLLEFTDYQDFIKHVSKNKVQYGIDQDKSFIKQVAKLWRQYKESLGDDYVPKKKKGGKVKKRVKKSKNQMKYKDFVKHVSANRQKYNINPDANLIKQIAKLWKEYKMDGKVQVGGSYIIVDGFRADPARKRVPLVKPARKDMKEKLKQRGAGMVSDQDMDGIKRFKNIVEEISKEMSVDAVATADSHRKASKKNKPKNPLKKELEILTSII